MSDDPQNLTTRLLCAIGAFFFRFRNALFPVIYLLVILLVPPAYFAGSRELDPVVTIFGAVVALSGQIIRCVTIGLVYIRRGGKDGKVHATNLITEGIFAHTRNPMYLGNLLLALGFCLMYGSAFMYAVVFPFFLLVYIGITFEEERFLSEKFGSQYQDYCRSTNRYLPRLQGLGETLRQHQFDWKKVIKKEYGTLFVFASGVYVILVFKYRYLLGPVGILGKPWLLATVAALLVLLYGTARFLKKTGRL